MKPATERSYSEAYDLLRGCKDPQIMDTPHPKVSQAAQSQVPGATRIVGSGVYATPKGRAFSAGRLLNFPTEEIPPHAARVKNFVTCCMRCVAIGGMHTVLLTWGPR